MSESYLSISVLTSYLKRKFDADPYLDRVYLTGEISNFRLRPGHQYFSLKDEKAKISAVMFKPAFSKLTFQPEEGMKVLVVGRISVFESSGNYQLYIEHMEPDGVGALYQAYEQLKIKLAKEGLFALPKQTLPKYPKRIAVLTSPSGSVVRDIITTVRRRYPIAQIVLYPTVVQGDKSADDVVRNLKRVEADGSFDTIILGRGGGSIEDLWPFNEERVARAIVAAHTPIISSVGHETDTTIADLVADVRAATPTAAAELAVPVLAQELLALDDKQMRLQQAFLFQLERQKQRYQKVSQSYVFKQPERLYEAKVQRLDLLMQRLTQQLQTTIYTSHQHATAIIHRLSNQQIKEVIARYQQQQAYLTERLQTAMMRNMQQKEQSMHKQLHALDLLSPLKIMGRGYSYTTMQDKIIKSTKQVTVGDQVVVHYEDGSVTMNVEAIHKEEV